MARSPGSGLPKTTPRRTPLSAATMGCPFCRWSIVADALKVQHVLCPHHALGTTSSRCLGCPGNMPVDVLPGVGQLSRAHGSPVSSKHPLAHWLIRLWYLAPDDLFLCRGPGPTGKGLGHWSSSGLLSYLRPLSTRAASGHPRRHMSKQILSRDCPQGCRSTVPHFGDVQTWC